jgi:DNA repair and recombination RAD54-like protein
LIKNLADENDPGGCILAHAPGSGKTFMVISFVQSFLARYPAGRPLIILPKGILATWRTEFLHWQIEKIPLYDFYSSKAGTRSEQLKVLNLWEENKSILLVGYEQFSHIISDQTCKSEAVQEKLLKVPSLVILDEGHTPRNEETKLLDSLGSIRTPRKVVLSGTLFQNKVREVFNILNLVRPRFLKMGRSRAIVKRILSKVDMLGKSARSRDISDKWFPDLVEANLQKDANDNVRAMIIQNLRELTANVLHYYPGELSEELPGLVDFTIFLNMSTKQEEILRGLVGLDKFSKRIKCNAVSLHPCLKDVQKDKGKNQDIVVRKIGGIISGIDINVGAKAKFLYNLLCLSEAAGEKVLVFSQYLRSLIFLEMMFRAKGLKPEVHMFKITGKSTPDQRNKAVERFNNSPDAKVFFGSIKACGEGISLVGASRVVILDVHENPSVMRQALGRAFRPGQSKMVYCYRLVAADSPEEEDHNTAFRKEWVSKMWFESNEFSGNDAFELSSVDVSESGDEFLESVTLRQDIRSLYKRYAYFNDE